MNTIDQDTLTARIRAAWGADTSASPVDWTPANPALGQCAVTALVIQDYFGGYLLRCEVGGVSHYYNVLADGTEIDLTREQFGGAANATRAGIRERAYVLSFPDTKRRYGLLLERVGQMEGK